LATFNDHRAYWHFAKSIKGKYRYVVSAQSKDFLEALHKMVKSNEAILASGTDLVRSQLGHGYRPLEDDLGNKIDEIPCAHSPERMKPLRDRAREGRVNPKGIPYLHLSNDMTTAIAETRPSIGQYISLGVFRVNRDCKLVRFTSRRKRSVIYLSSPPKQKIDRLVWEDLNMAFSMPVQPDDETSDYAPTQVIAEYIKSLGYDGIVYRSRLGPGLSIALFDLDAADLTSCALYSIGSIKYTHSLADNPYFVSQTKKRKTRKAEK